MEENVAIVKKKQKSFQKSIDNYKKLLKSGEIKVVENAPAEEKIDRRETRGIVYISNIPHGFYEEEMKQYFAQFGKVTRLRLARSKNTGKSKGFAFIEFKIPEVAQIVAETMNNYLMCKRLVKAKYIPPEEQHEFYFKGRNWTEKKYPKLENRKMSVKRVNKVQDNKKVLQTAKKLLKGIEDVKTKLLKVGIVYNFEPVDIPDALNYKKTEISTEIESSENDDSDSENNELELDIKNKKPTVFIHESDDSDIVVNVPPDYNTVIVPKSKPVKKVQPKKEKSVKPKITEKKLTGVLKKTKAKKAATLNKDSRKMKLIQKNILNDNQITLKNFNEIKKKKNMKK